MNMNTETIFQCTVGSHAYGTATETSDLDMLEVFLAPVDSYIGLKKSKSSHKIEGKDDIQRYELIHFISLCLEFNPNVITSLWVKPQHVLYQHIFYFTPFLHNVVAFSSQKVYNTFRGYANQQRKRMLGEITGQLGEKRKDLKEKYGYDTKYAYHAVRLLRMCREFLDTHKLNVYREDGEELYRIRNGKLSLQELEDLIAVEERKCEDSMGNTTLPKEPNYDWVNSMLIKSLKDYIITY